MASGYLLVSRGEDDEHTSEDRLSEFSTAVAGHRWSAPNAAGWKKPAALIVPPSRHGWPGP